MTDLSDFAQIAAADRNLCVVSTLRAGGTIQSSVVNAGVLDTSPAGAPVVAFVAHGGSQKLANLRARPVTTIVARSGLAGSPWRAPPSCANLTTRSARSASRAFAFCCGRSSRRPVVLTTTGTPTTA